MNLIKIYLSLIGVYYLLHILYIGSSFINTNFNIQAYLGYGTYEIYGFLVLIFSFLLFFWSGIFCLKDFIKNSINIKSQKFIFFMISCIFLGTFGLQSGVQSIFGSNQSYIFESQRLGKIPVIMPNGDLYYNVNGQYQKVLNK